MNQNESNQVDKLRTLIFRLLDATIIQLPSQLAARQQHGERAFWMHLNRRDPQPMGLSWTPLRVGCTNKENLLLRSLFNFDRKTWIWISSTWRSQSWRPEDTSRPNTSRSRIQEDQRPHVHLRDVDLFGIHGRPGRETGGDTVPKDGSMVVLPCFSIPASPYLSAGF